MVSPNPRQGISQNYPGISQKISHPDSELAELAYLLVIHSFIIYRVGTQND